MVLCNGAVWQISTWLSALRQPAHQSAAPKCHMPSPWQPPVLRQSAQRHQFSKAAQAIVNSACIHGRWFTVRIQVSRSVAFLRLTSLALIPSLRHVRHNSIQSHNGGGWRMQRSSIINHQGTVGLFSLAVPSRTSLTFRSSRQPQVSLVVSLGASRSGAAYLGR